MVGGQNCRLWGTSHFVPSSIHFQPGALEGPRWVQDVWALGRDPLFKEVEQLEETGILNLNDAPVNCPLNTNAPRPGLQL